MLVAGCRQDTAILPGQDAWTATGGAASAASVGDGDEVALITPSGRPIFLEVARSDAKRALGMMNRAEVPEGTGMLFLFEADGLHSFWMHNCLVALDIVWIDADGLVIDVLENAPPCPKLPCASHRPRTPARYVIEVGAGRAQGLGLVTGARVLIDQALRGDTP